MKKPSAYEIATHKGRQADEARSSDYCGSCSIEIHCAQVRDPKSWVHSSIKVWEKLGGWCEEENSEAKDSPKSGYETVASIMAERDALRARVEAMRQALNHILAMQTRGFITLGDNATSMANDAMQAKP